MIKAGVISIGNELLSGQSVDTNLGYLSRELLSIGIPVVGCWTVGDEISSIKDAIGHAVEKADIVLITGGLGPTDDDLTRQGLAEFMGVELEFQEGLFEEISAFFTGRGYKMAEVNEVQAYIPVGSVGLSNKAGTAPGILAKFKGKILAAMPGVPAEMKRMFNESVLFELESLGSGHIVVIKKLRCFGAGESTISQELGDIMRRGRNPLINITASGGVITLHIVASGYSKAAVEKLITEDESRIREVFGDIIFGRDDETLADVVGKELTGQKKTVAVAESCSGGLIAKMLTDRAGASGYFTYGWVTYSNEAKIEQLGVSPELIDKYGAVSEQAALAMAGGAREKAGSDFAIAVTGIAGPGGSTAEKPLGLVYIALETANFRDVSRFIFSGLRGQNRVRAALTALNMLRLRLKI